MQLIAKKLSTIEKKGHYITIKYHSVIQDLVSVCGQDWIVIVAGKRKERRTWQEKNYHTLYQFFKIELVHVNFFLRIRVVLGVFAFAIEMNMLSLDSSETNKYAYLNILVKSITGLGCHYRKVASLVDPNSAAVPLLCRS